MNQPPYEHPNERPVPTPNPACKKHLGPFSMEGDLATSAIVSYAMGYVVAHHNEDIRDILVDKVCTWIARHWDAFDCWQQENITASCQYHNKHPDVARLISWMKQHSKNPTGNEATPKPNAERKLCR